MTTHYSTTISWLTIAILTLNGCIRLLPPQPYERHADYPSPTSRYTVAIDAAPAEAFFGPESIRIYITDRQTNTRTLLLQTPVYNDGGGFTDNNIETRWLDPGTLQVCLSGDEQETQILTIDASTNSFTEAKGPCPSTS